LLLLQKLFPKNKILNYLKIPYSIKVIVRSYQKINFEPELLTVNMLISYRYPEVKSDRKIAFTPMILLFLSVFFIIEKFLLKADIND